MVYGLWLRVKGQGFKRLCVRGSGSERPRPARAGSGGNSHLGIARVALHRARLCSRRVRHARPRGSAFWIRGGGRARLTGGTRKEGNKETWKIWKYGNIDSAGGGGGALMWPCWSRRRLEGLRSRWMMGVTQLWRNERARAIPVIHRSTCQHTNKNTSVMTANQPQGNPRARPPWQQSLATTLPACRAALGVRRLQGFREGFREEPLTGPRQLQQSCGGTRGRGRSPGSAVGPVRMPTKQRVRCYCTNKQPEGRFHFGQTPTKPHHVRCYCQQGKPLPTTDTQPCAGCGRTEAAVKGTLDKCHSRRNKCHAR